METIDTHLASTLGLRALVLVLVALGVDALARRAGMYELTAERWPALWRGRARPRDEADGPYRGVDHVAWELVRAAGVPRGVSATLLPVFAMALLWSIASILAMGDLVAFTHRGHTRAFSLASFALCVTRAALAWASVGATLERWRRATVLWSLAALALDVTLALVALPCSDHRADDVRMAQSGAVAQGVALVAFLWATRRRAGITDVDPQRQPPTN
jgi:hypothetical protein